LPGPALAAAAALAAAVTASAPGCATSVAARVEGDNPVVPGKERHLHLPVPGVHDGPGGQQQEVRLAGAVHLVVNSHAELAA
jgi:hypothetical protein